MWWPDAGAWQEFSDLVDRTCRTGQSLDRFERDLLALGDRSGWSAALPFDDRCWRHAFARGLFTRQTRIEYGRQRLAQLREAGFKFWVYRQGDREGPCAADHADLDGLALPPDHEFWTIFFPPNGPDCQCQVSGARTEAGILRLGGNPDKYLPVEWRAIFPDPVWPGSDWPDLQSIFAEVLREQAE